jgi:hypothetical protein
LEAIRKHDLILFRWGIGQLVGMPALGAIVSYSAGSGLPPYPVLFVAMAAVLAIVGAVHRMSEAYCGRLGYEPKVGQDGRILA